MKMCNIIEIYIFRAILRYMITSIFLSDVSYVSHNEDGVDNRRRGDLNTLAYDAHHSGV